MNKLSIEIMSDDREWLQRHQESAAYFFENNRNVTFFSAFMSTTDDEATMGVPPDGETPYDVVTEKEQEEIDPINLEEVIQSAKEMYNEKREVIMEPTTLKFNRAAFGNGLANGTNGLSFHAKVDYPVEWAEEGDFIRAKHYNQLLTLIMQLREDLWALQSN